MEMGFPTGCSELAVPKLVVCLVISLAHLRRFLASTLAFLGVSDLLLPSDPPPQVPSPFLLRPTSHSRVKDALPSAPYRSSPSCCSSEEESCAVCLYEFEDGDDVRSLRECCHVFHRRCLDPWVDLGRRTCPLCRAPLLAGEEAETEDELLDVGFDESELLEYSVEEDLDWRPIDHQAPPLQFLNADELLLAARMRLGAAI